LKEDTGLVEPDDGVREIELLEDDAGVVREVGDVVLEVLAGLGATQIAKRVFGRVVERVAGGLTENQVKIDPGILEGGMAFADTFAGRLQYAFQVGAAG
jgi:hypothetical protein